MTGWLIFISIIFIILTILVISTAENKLERVVGGLALIACAFILVGSFCYNEYLKTIETLKQEYPILAEAMQEKELKAELEALLEDKQVNDERYQEIIKELK